MMKRLKLATRILLGLPLRGVRIDEDYLMDEDSESEFDYTKAAPIDLVFGDVLKDKPPVAIFEEERFRVCVFAEEDKDGCNQCGRGLRWLVLELHDDDKWHHLVTLHESRLAVMLGVLHDVGDSLDGYRVAGENMCRTRDLPRRK